MKNITTNPKPAAFIGLLSVLPFMIMNVIVANRIEPFISILRPDTHTSLLELVLLFVVLFLLPVVGAFIAGRPVLRKGASVERKFYFLNVVIAAILLVGSITLSVALGLDIYRCDFLQIPNCD